MATKTSSEAPSPPAPATTNVPIAVDDVDADFDSDADSAIGAGGASATTTIASSILRYRTLHGRTYHSETGNAKYWGSNDAPQSESMDVLHYLVMLSQDDNLYLAPIKDDIQKVVDIGTGTGTWAIDFADQHPGCEVIGTDVSPIQPTWVPPNLKFEIEDCTQSWTFAPNSIDYVHIKYLVGSIADWNELFKQAFIVTKPGGWLESLEGTSVFESDDDTNGEALEQWGKFFIDGGKKIGRTFTVYSDGLQRKAMEAAGFVDIQEREFKCPLGKWPKDPKYKEVGNAAQVALEGDIEGYILFMANVLGWSHDEVTVYVAKFRAEMRSGKHHVYFRMRAVWGRKPEDVE